MDSSIRSILEKYPDYQRTCSLDSLEDGCITFSRRESYLGNLAIGKNVVILVPKGFSVPELANVTYEFVDSIDYTFVTIHNFLNKDRVPMPNYISPSSVIYPNCIIGAEGINLVKDPNGKRIQMKHMGNVVIEDDVHVLSFVSIPRAVFGSTTVKRGVHIAHHVNVGHNCFIDEDSVVTSGAILGGSSRLGKNVVIGLGAIIKPKVKICGGVFVGMGAVVTSDIVEPGIYVGNPAKYLKEYDREREKL